MPVAMRSMAVRVMDHLYPGADSDYVFRVFGSDQNLIDGGDGFDFVRYDNLNYGIAADLLFPNLSAGSGYTDAHDRYISIEGIVGTNYDDYLVADDGANWLYGYAGDDNLYGRGGDNSLIGGLGNDRLFGMDGNDQLYGEAGDDSLYGGDGNDALTGGDGDDDLNGDAGDDVLAAGDGNDILRGGAGADTFYGGNGNDTAHYAFYASATTSVIDLVVWNENTGVAAGDTFDSVENVVGSLTNDQIRGDDGVNMLDGSGGNDLIYGRGGDDIIIGGTGNDALVGNAGNDFLLGGSGSPFGGGFNSDQFYFGLGDGRDTIGDFQAGTGQGDTLYLSAALGVTDFAEAMSFATQALRA